MLSARNKPSAFPFICPISPDHVWNGLGDYWAVCVSSGTLWAAIGQLTGNHPLFYLAVYSPAIAAFILVARTGGISGLQRFLGRVLLWRCSAAWYAFLIIGIPLIFIIGSAFRGNLRTEPFPFASIQSLFTALLLAAIKGPVEEFGWRGLALPLLQGSSLRFGLG